MNKMAIGYVNVENRMGSTQRKIQPDFIEAKTVEEANLVDKNVYRLERFSESRQAYIFVKRSR